MRKSFQVFFLDQEYRVIEKRSLRPWRIAWNARAKHVLEIFVDERGQSLVEFALIVPLLFMLLFGLLHMGIAFNIKNQMVFAANQGAQVGSLTNNDSKIIDVITASFPYPGIEASIVSLDAETGKVTIPTVNRLRNDYVSVRLKYVYTRFIIPFLGINQDLTLHAQATSRVICFNSDPQRIPPNTCP